MLHCATKIQIAAFFFQTTAGLDPKSLALWHLQLRVCMPAQRTNRGCSHQKILVSVKFVSATLGPEMAAPILWTPGKMPSFCRKTSMSIKILVLGGGDWGLGGGSADFIFMGAGIFLITTARSKLPRGKFNLSITSKTIPSARHPVRLVFLRRWSLVRGSWEWTSLRLFLPRGCCGVIFAARQRFASIGPLGGRRPISGLRPDEVRKIAEESILASPGK